MMAEYLRCIEMCAAPPFQVFFFSLALFMYIVFFSVSVLFRDFLFAPVLVSLFLVRFELGNNSLLIHFEA